jgi:transposase-like protein
MTRPLLALMRLKPKLPNSDGLEQCFRRSFSLSSGLYGPEVRSSCRPWTAEESRKLLELYQEGVSTSKIAKALDHRSLLSVRSHIAFLRDPSPETSSGKQWTAEEDTILAAKRQAGIAYKDIHIPGRSRHALQQRMKHLRSEHGRLHGDARKPASAARSSKGNSTKGYTDAQAERIVKLRIEGQMSFQDIAIEMGISKRLLHKLWFARCKHLLPEQVLYELRASNAWTPEDDDLLVTRYNKGDKLDNLQAHFPNKTGIAVKNRLYALRNRLVARQPKLSPAQIESLKQELEPYIGASLRRADAQGLLERYHPVTYRAIHSTLHRMRHGKATPPRMPLDEMEAEGRIASRRR